MIDQLRTVLRQPEVIVGAWRAVRAHGDGLTETGVREAPHALDPVWDELFPAEQARLVQLLIQPSVARSAESDATSRLDCSGKVGVRFGVTETSTRPKRRGAL